MGTMPPARWEQIINDVLDMFANQEDRDRLNGLLVKLGQAYIGERDRYFRQWEDAGFHLTPADYTQPIPDSRTLDDELWDRPRETPGIDWNEAGQLYFLEQAFPRFCDEYNELPLESTECPHQFFDNNPMFRGVDAIALYCMVRHFRPRLVLEVGSGFSSRLAAQAALKNGDTRLVCIEPYPDALLRQGFPGLDSLFEVDVQHVSLEMFRQLGPNDILFIDSSHIAKCGSDVNYLFLEVLPRLAPGVIVHVHDIFLPAEYPKRWVKDLHIFYTEQYLLQAFLVCNSEFEVLFANAYLELKHNEKIRAAFPRVRSTNDGSFWMRRRLRT